MSSEPESHAEPEKIFISTTEPEPETTAEPENGYFSTLKPEPEIGPGSLPESFIFLSSSVGSSAPKTWPEPEPEWSSAFQAWGTAWPLHIYIFGTCYIIALIYTTICTVVIVKTLRVGKGKLTLSLLVSVILFNLSRAVSLFVDPYFAFNHIPFLTSRIIWSLGLPFLTSSFSLVFLVLLDTTKMDIGPPKFQKFSAILIVTGIHVTVVVTTDFIVFYEAAAKAMLVVCQGLFMAYGMILTIGYMYVGIKMRKNCSAGSMHESTTVRRLIVLCFISSATSLAIVATYIYSAAGVFGVYSTKTYVESWPWWIFQTFLRVEELISVGVVLTIASNSEQLRDLFSRLCRKGTTVKPIFIQQDNKTNITDLPHSKAPSKTSLASLC